MAVPGIDQIGDLPHGLFGNREGMRRRLETVVNVGMREQATAHVGADEHERSQSSRGYRNGSKPRKFKTRLGELELSVPQVRNCEPHPPASSPAGSAASGPCWWRAGGCTSRASAPATCGRCWTRNYRPSASGGSATAPGSNSAWQYLMLDARYEKVRVDGKAVGQAVLTVVGFAAGGRREMPDRRVADSESGRSRGGQALFKSLKGLMGDLAGVFAPEEKQECLVRAEEMAVRWERTAPAVAAMLRAGIEDCLAVLSFPEHHRRKFRSTNLLENRMRRLKKRTKVVGVFPNRGSCDRLIGSQLLELHEQWQTEPKACVNMEYAGA